MTRTVASVRRFTGWHMTAILVAFFAVVIAVNVLMATIAVRSFGGTVVDNSYVASQKFNLWLKEARAQDRLGWRNAMTLTADRHPQLVLDDATGAPVAGAVVSGVAAHPLGRAPDILLTFQETASGRFTGNRALPAGRWNLRLDIRHGADEQHVLGEVD